MRPIDKTYCSALTLVILLSGLYSAIVPAHPGVHESLAVLDQHIAADPENAALYLQRGHLLADKERYDEALADFGLAAALDPTLMEVHLAKGQLYLEAGWPRAAQVELERFLKARAEEDEGFPKGMLLLGRARRDSGDLPGAADALDEALRVTPRHTPDLILEVGRALAAAGRPAVAIERLDAAIEDFKALTSLHQAALEIEVAAGWVEAALRRLDQRIEEAPFPERWLARKGALLASEGRTAEARNSYETALEALAARPAEKRVGGTLANLERQVRERLMTLPE